MTKHDFRPVYAEGNPDWRIRYQANGLWELQEYTPLPVTADRRRQQPWLSHNAFMSYDDAVVALGRYAKRRA